MNVGEEQASRSITNVSWKAHGYGESSFYCAIVHVRPAIPSSISRQSGFRSDIPSHPACARHQRPTATSDSLASAPPSLPAAAIDFLAFGVSTSAPLLSLETKTFCQHLALFDIYHFFKIHCLALQFWTSLLPIVDYHHCVWW